MPGLVIFAILVNVLVKNLAALLECNWEGDGESDLHDVASLEDAGPDDLAFASRGKAMQLVGDSLAGCLLVPLDFPNSARKTIIRAANPRGAMARAIKKLLPQNPVLPGVHHTAILGPGCTIDPGVSIGPFVSIGAGTKVGAGSFIGTGTVIGDFVHIGEKCTIHPRVTIYDKVTLGREVVLHSGTVIGADGFGYVFENGAYENFPQVGRVVIGDRVEIGANSCIDRAALGVTVIGNGTKLDNMVHVAHNCQIGQHVVVAAQTGFSGGVVVEDYAVVGGQVGVGDKARIETRAVVGSGSGILSSKIIRAGDVVWGTPARPLKEHLKALAELNKLAQTKGKKDKSAASRGEDALASSHIA